MTAHVTIEGFKDAITDWKGRPIAAVGDTVTLIVKLWNYKNLKGGRFRIKHGGIDPLAHVFEVPKRRATGLKGLKATKNDLERESTIDCAVTVTAATTDWTFFVLEALENCVTEDNDKEKLRTFADAGQRDARRLEVRRGYDANAPRRLDVTRAGNQGLPAEIGNTVRAQVSVHLSLHFKDPDGVERPLPKDTPVKAVLGDEPRHAIDAAVGDDGKLDVEVIGHADAVVGKTLTLRFGASADNQVICELPGGTASQVRAPLPPAGDATGTIPARVFALPRNWSLRQSDWAVSNDGGRWDGATATFSMTANGLAASLGKRGDRVKLVLDPHWQFVRFDHFDRRYGHSDHSKKPKSMPAVMLEGFRYKPTSPTSKPDVRSNWYVEQGGEVVQCVPWIVQRKDDGTARKRPDRHTLLRFELPAKTCLHAESATKRTRVVATDKQLEPGPERLDYYDLPEKWSSQNYYAKLSATAGEFGWYEDVAGKPTTKAKPLVFSLDDVVLTDESCRRLATWTHPDRLAIFVHTFDDSLGGATKEGVYKPDTGDKKPWYTKAPDAGAPEENENYVVDRPLWARLIAAKGSLFDVFDKRTVESSPADPDYDVIGARAAVRWVDATAQLGATTVGDFSGVGGAWAWSATNAPRPGMTFFPSWPDRTDKPHFSVQPYYTQHYMERFGKYSVAGDSGNIGRFDMALVRSCGVAKVDNVDTELAVNLCFHRMCFDFAFAPDGMGEEDFLVRYARTVMDRFNGLDAKNGQGRAEVLPQEPAKRPIKAAVVHFIQMTPEDEAHFKITTADHAANARDFRTGSGLGETSNSAPEDGGTTDGFTNAHEHGHQSALPDEYNERWDAASYGQPSFYSTLPGDPYELDGRVVEFAEDNAPMMNGCHTLHNRYYWQSAEWVRQILGASMKVKLGGTYDDYKLPPYTVAKEAQRHYAFWPIAPEKYDVAIAPVAPLTVNRGKVDMYLYALGADNFAVKTLPDREDGGGATPYDGILMVTVRCHVKAWGVKREDEDDLKQLVQGLGLAVRRGGTRKLNHVWYLTGKHGKGTREEWAFARCLVHFSPRFVVSGVADLETVADWDSKVGVFNAETVWTDAKALLEDYHNTTWEDPNKRARLDTLIGPAAEPNVDIRGAWNRTHASVAGLNNDLSAFEGLPDDPPIDRYNAAEAFRDECDQWLSAKANKKNSRRADVSAMRGRAEAARLTLGALCYVRELEELAQGLKDRDDEHEKKVVEVTATHPAQFVVRCVSGTPASAVWDPAPLQGDLPDPTAWATGLPTSAQLKSTVDKYKGLLTKYRSKDRLDMVARVKALDEIIGPLAMPAGADPKGTWADGGKPELQGIKGHLDLFDAAGAEDFDGRATHLEAAQLAAEAAAIDNAVAQGDRTAAEQLATRIELAVDTLRTMKKVRELEAHAKVFKDHLERWVASTTVILKADSKAGFEEMMLEAFPSMIGAYKSASKLEGGDIKAFASQLGLDNLKVCDITEGD